ncbi:MAG: gliding motility-associated C-terminal domain-containing protein [Bacteroidales bacterium]|nr:gliding motility-associated C-terminal domain-containing protein [Bacteroidales bacterium]
MRFIKVFTIITALAFSRLLPAQVDFQVSDSIGCAPMQVSFTLNTDTLTSFQWMFGEGPVSTQQTPVHTYENAGKYKVVLNYTNDSVVKFVTVHETVTAAFEYETASSPLEYRFLPLGNISTDSTSFRWEVYSDTLLGAGTRVGNMTFPFKLDASEAVYEYEFSDTAYFAIKLNVTTNWFEGSQRRHCSDSSVIVLFAPEELEPSDTISRDSVFAVANVFVPTTQDYYIIDPKDPAVVLSFQVFSRTGVLVYKSESPVIYWDGRNISGQVLGTGVYYFVLEAISGDNSGYYSSRGFIHLFR